MKRILLAMVLMTTVLGPGFAQQGTPEIFLDGDDLFGEEPSLEPEDPIGDAFARCLGDPTDALSCAISQSNESGLESAAGLETVVIDPDETDPNAVVVNRTSATDVLSGGPGSDKQTSPDRGSHGLAMVEVDIFFDYDSSRVRASEFRKIEELAAALSHKENVDKGFLLIGHTDSKGSEAYNCRLSQGRAEAIVAALAEQGVPTERLTAIGAGERVLRVASNPQSEQNRRVGLSPLTDQGAAVLSRMIKICR